MRMCSEANSSVSLSSSSSPSTKRSRDPEDEVYVDNLHSHKRYLSEIMASSLNGLTVGDPLTDNLMESPARSDNLFYLRDDMCIQYSPMSDDSDDSRYCDTTINTCSSQPESLQTSPVSPYRYQRPLGGFSYAPPTTTPNPYQSSSIPHATSQPRQRNTDTEGRFPSSPSDICHSADLRRAALLRSVQMRTQPVGPSPFELPFTPGQVSVHNIEETEERPCSFMKSLVDQRDYSIDECTTFSIPEPEYSMEKSCTVVNMKVDEPVHYEGNEAQPCSFISLGDERDYQIQELPSFVMSEPEFKGGKSCMMKTKGDEPADKPL